MVHAYIIVAEGYRSATTLTTINSLYQGQQGDINQSVFYVCLSCIYLASKVSIRHTTWTGMSFRVFEFSNFLGALLVVG